MTIYKTQGQVWETNRAVSHQFSAENVSVSVLSYHPMHQTCLLWSSLWRKSGTLGCYRCFCQTRAWPLVNLVSSPHPSARERWSHQNSICFMNVKVKHLLLERRCLTHYLASYLCKILLWDASCPFYTKLQRPAWVGYICTLYQHPLDKDAILRRRQNALDRLLITVPLLTKQTKNVHEFKDNRTLTGRTSSPTGIDG